MGAERHVRLFKNGRSQAVRIPREFELPGDEFLVGKSLGCASNDVLHIAPAGLVPDAPLSFHRAVHKATSWYTAGSE